VDEVDEEDGAEEEGLDVFGPVGGEGHAEVVRIGEAFFQEAGPFFGDLAEDLLPFADLEGPRVQERAEQFANLRALDIADGVLAPEDGEVSPDIAQRLTGGIIDDG